MKRAVPINKPAGAEASGEPDKHISFCVRVFEWAFIITLVVFVVFGSYTWHSYTEFQKSENEYDEVLKIEGTITYLDEVLTMSARMAAATGDMRWEERYKSFVPKLDAAVKRVIALVPHASIAEPAARTDAANTRLLAMEKKAFDLVRQGRGKDALALLQGEEYERQKLLYRLGSRQYAVALGQYIKARSHEFRKLTLFEIVFAGILIFAAAFSGSCVLQMFRRIAVRDRTDRVIRMAYEELETSSNELKQMQSQLVQNEKLASIGQLAAGVAHEMNTPIGFVASNFQTLKSYVEKIKKLLGMYDEMIEEIGAAERNDLLEKAGVIKEKYKEMKIDFILEDIEGLFDDSKEGLERVESIVQNLRDFSRIDQPGSTDEYDLNRGIKATLVVARNEIKYDADIKTEFSEVPTTRCHAGQINQVLLNIILNAAQAIESQERQDRGMIAIRTYSTEKEVVCEISDDGPGIPPEVLSRVFDPFFTTKPVGKGTGLGLSVSYDIIVHKNNGKLLVDSTVGKGTKFTIRLPIRNEEISGEIEVESNGQENSVICG